MITTISFDADGTLWDFSSVMHQALALTLAELRALVPSPESEVLTVDDLKQIRDEVARPLVGKKIFLEHIRYLAFEQTLKRLGRDDPELAGYLTTSYLDHRFTAIKLYSDVLPSLQAEAMSHLDRLLAQ